MAHRLTEEVDLESLQQGGLEAFARQGARLLLEVSMAAEVSEFLGRSHYERSDVPGYRNGHRRRKLTCGSGQIELEVPKITGADGKFSLQTIPAWQRTSPDIEKVLPLLYAEGLSTRDFSRALGEFWAGAGLSRSSVSRANEELYRQCSAWKRRDLSKLRVVYLFLDGYYERVRFGSDSKEGILVAHAILEDGSRELLGLVLGPKESEAAWKRLLEDLDGRGLKPPRLVIIDGNQGLSKALKAVWPKVLRHRCTAHKTRNVLDCVPRKHQARVKKALAEIFHAPDLEAAKSAVGSFLSTFGDEFPTAGETLARDIESSLSFYKFPEAHWKRIRTSNALERAFREVRRRTRVVEHFPNERSALTLVWACLETDRMKWRGVRIDAKLLKAVDQAAEELARNPIRIESVRKYLKAA
jgi:transposase-like protein